MQTHRISPHPLARMRFNGARTLEINAPFNGRDFVNKIIESQSHTTTTTPSIATKKP